MKVKIIYRLEASSGILIGSTSEALSIGIDKATIRRRQLRENLKKDAKQEPLIPGSTLKGKIRNECERLLTGLGKTICRAPRAETMCPHYIDKNKPLICDVCQLFGGPSEQSRLFFSDAVAKFPNGTEIGEEDARFTTRVQAGVSISRNRRTAEDERLYYMERGVEGLMYEGTIDGYLDDNLAQQQSALLIASIEQLVAVGGSKSRGAGWTNARVSSVAFDDKLLSGDELQRIRQEGLKAWR